MAWTDERVARLSKLWAEGLSASQIAADLGEVSRNAVIGKVHRLGLSGRAKPGGNAGGRPKRQPVAPASAGGQSGGQGGGSAGGGEAGADVTQFRPAAQSSSTPMGGAAVNGPSMNGTTGRPGTMGATGGGQGFAASMRGAMGGGMGGGHVVGATALKIDAEDEMVLEARVRDAEDVVVPMSKKLTLLELTESTCKWPTGDPQRPGFSFCGHVTKEDTPYCEHHAKVAFQPPSERRRRR